MKCMHCDCDAETLCYDVTKSKLLLCKECMNSAEKLSYAQLIKETKKFIEDIQKRIDAASKMLGDYDQK
jgi:hypothetical protein